MPDVQTRIHPERGRSTGSVDVLDEYWADFLFFRKEALISEESGDTFRTHRFLRCGLFTFLNYLTGLLNRWDLPSEGTEENRSAFLPVHDRLVQIANLHQWSHPPRDDMRLLTTLACRCSDLQPSDEKDLLQDLGINKVDAAEQKVLGWLENLSRTSGLRLHSGSQVFALRDSDRLEVPTQEDYQEFEAFKDEPHPFQDPPGTWEEIEPDSKA